jgi:hypothetical protein
VGSFGSGVFAGRSAVADIDFPNDLLLELDERRFLVEETGQAVAAQVAPIVMIMSNDEKDLPDAFYNLPSGGSDVLFLFQQDNKAIRLTGIPGIFKIRIAIASRSELCNI